MNPLFQDILDGKDKEIDRLKREKAELVEWLQMVVGFTVAFREDNECWEKHTKDVGVLYAKSSTLLSKLSREGK